MEFITTILPDLAKQTITGAVLMIIWIITWRYFTARQEKNDEITQKKDDAILNLMTDHSTKLLEVSEKSIESSNLLNMTLGRLGDKLEVNHQQVLREIDDLKPAKKGGIRTLNSRPVEVAATPVA